MAQSLVINNILPLISPSPPVDEVHFLRETCSAMVKGFLNDCGIPYRAREVDQNLFEAACDSATKRGCCMSGPGNLLSALRVGASFGSTSYRHREFDVQLFTALFTAYATYMDDMCARDASLVGKFVDNFILNKPQGHPVLDAFAGLLLEMPEKFSEVVSNLMITSSLNLITAWLLEADVPHMIVRYNVELFCGILIKERLSATSECIRICKLCTLDIGGARCLLPLYFPPRPSSWKFYSRFAGYWDICELYQVSALY